MVIQPQAGVWPIWVSGVRRGNWRSAASGLPRKLANLAVSLPTKPQARRNSSNPRTANPLARCRAGMPAQALA